MLDVGYVVVHTPHINNTEPNMSNRKDHVVRSTQANTVNPKARYVSYFAPSFGAYLVTLEQAQRFTAKQAAQVVRDSEPGSARAIDLHTAQILDR